MRISEARKLPRKGGANFDLLSVLPLFYLSQHHCRAIATI